MNVYLLYQNKDADLKKPLPWNSDDLRKDLELDTLFNAMGGDDKFMVEVATHTVFSGLDIDVQTILYRQFVLKDCLKNAAFVRNIYAISLEAIELNKSSWYRVFSSHPSSVLSNSVGMMGIYVDVLKKLRTVADEHSSQFESAGFRSFFDRIQTELTDNYFETVQKYLAELKLKDGILFSAGLGRGNKGIHYVLRRLTVTRPSWWRRLFPKKEKYYTFSIHRRDDVGARALAALRNEGINLVANAIAQSSDHIIGFFNLLRIELAFYLGCINLHQQLKLLQEPVCFPVPIGGDERKYSFAELYEVCLALSINKKITGNHLKADDKNPVIITGANKGGKTTFLRSIGVAQLMMQCGMFVPAASFSANTCENLFTHFKRAEDPTMKSGKFDEELNRMSEIADHLTSHSLVLFNESFAATNEREGSTIAAQIVRALTEKKIKVFFVTHMYTFAEGFYSEKSGKSFFLRAERQHDDGRRSFKMETGAPLQTSYATDVYERIFKE